MAKPNKLDRIWALLLRYTETNQSDEIGCWTWASNGLMNKVVMEMPNIGNKHLRGV